MIRSLAARKVLEEPEEEKTVKPPPVATAPVETFTPKALFSCESRLRFQDLKPKTYVWSLQK